MAVVKSNSSPKVITKYENNINSLVFTMSFVLVMNVWLLIQSQIELLFL